MRPKHMKGMFSPNVTWHSYFFIPCQSFYKKEQTRWRNFFSSSGNASCSSLILKYHAREGVNSWNWLRHRWLELRMEYGILYGMIMYSCEMQDGTQDGLKVQIQTFTDETWNIRLSCYSLHSCIICLCYSNRCQMKGETIWFRKSIKMGGESK